MSAAGGLESSGVFAAGSSDSARNASIDGANVQMALYNMPVTLQSASTVVELRIETASTNAEFGYGSNATNVITINGANAFHSEAFGQHRNDNPDAQDFFTPHRREGGFLLGGRHRDFAVELGDAAILSGTGWLAPQAHAIDRRSVIGVSAVDVPQYPGHRPSPTAESMRPARPARRLQPRSLSCLLQQRVAQLDLVLFPQLLAEVTSVEVVADLPIQPQNPPRLSPAAPACRSVFSSHDPPA